MYNLLLMILLILSVIIVIAIFMQPTKNQSSNVLTPALVIYLNDQKREVLRLLCRI